ncbi:MAG: lipase family protein [Pseudomonadota bacterium]|nr:lipase family protein [Pseudomonadota bacterium]
MIRKISRIPELGRPFLMAFAVVLFNGCDAGDIFNGDDEGGGEPSGAPYEIATAVEAARLGLYAYQQLDDFRANRTFTLPAPWTLTDQFFSDRRFSGESAGPGATLPIGFSATGNGRIYVVFRGSQTISDWISNAQFKQVDYPYVSGGGMTHQGFTDIYASLRDAVATSVTAAKTQFPNATVTLAGHSLGGALATLTGPDLRERTGFVPVLYNFASPRVGNPEFSRRHEGLVETSWRTVNTNDTVPNLPPNTVVVLDENNRPVTLSYDHVRNRRPITFGDSADIPGSHSLCNYYSTLCDETTDPNSCKALGEGVDDCLP